MWLKKATIIFTVILIAIFSVGSFFVYSCYLTSYKKAFQSYVKNEKAHLSTTQISINRSQFHVNSTTIVWEDDYKEIIVDGILYDIVSVEIHDEKVDITVLSDTQEQEIKKEFALTYDASSSKSSNNPIKLLKQFLALKFLNHPNQDLDFSADLDVPSFYTEYLFSIKPVFLSQETPPPSLQA